MGKKALKSLVKSEKNSALKYKLDVKFENDIEDAPLKEGTILPIECLLNTRR